MNFEITSLGVLKDEEASTDLTKSLRADLRQVSTTFVIVISLAFSVGIPSLIRVCVSLSAIASISSAKVVKFRLSKRREASLDSITDDLSVLMCDCNTLIISWIVDTLSGIKDKAFPSNLPFMNNRRIA